MSIAFIAVVLFASLLALYLLVFLIVLAVGGTAAVSGSALGLFLGLGRRRRKRELADYLPHFSSLASEPEMYASIIESIR